MSATLTSFWKSTKCLLIGAPGRRGGLTHNASMGCSGTLSTLGERAPPRLRKPAAAAAALPASRPSERQKASAKVPLAAPAERSACTDSPGTKQARSGEWTRRPPDCEKRCTVGASPPDMATRSQASARGAPA